MEDKADRTQVLYEVGNNQILELVNLMGELVEAVQDIASAIQRIDSRLKSGIVTYPQSE
jgi:hypothetical protein